MCYRNILLRQAHFGYCHNVIRLGLSSVKRLLYFSGLDLCYRLCFSGPNFCCCLVGP
jgi:hypothetical protein